jgi:hypothetical protein
MFQKGRYFRNTPFWDDLKKIILMAVISEIPRFWDDLKNKTT